MQFVKYDRTQEQDAAVLRHEVGHAYAWLNYGGCVGRLRMERLSSGQLVASTCFGAAIQDKSVSFAEANCVRLLAGEVAGRKFLHMSPREIVCDPIIPIRYPAHQLSSYLTTLQTPEDINKALGVAVGSAGNDWYSWLKDRHFEARSIVTAGWVAIESVAKDLEQYLPQTGATPIELPGQFLVDRFNKYISRALPFHATAC